MVIWSKSLLYRSKTTIFKVPALNKLRKKRRKNRKKSMRICTRKIEAKKSHKNRFWEALGLHLGGVGGGLGPLLGALGRLLVVFWSFEIEFFPSIGPRWAPRGLLDRFWVDFGRILGGFGRVLGGIWDDFWFDFGKVLRNEGEPALNLNSTLHVKVEFPLLEFFYVRTPVLS